MVTKNYAKKTRFGRITNAIFVGVVLLVSFVGGVFFLILWFFADADSSTEGHLIALLMGVAFLGMAALLVYGLTRPSAESPSAVAEQIGVPDSVQHLDNARPKANIPNALRGQEPPSGAVIVAGGSIWFSRVLLMVALAIAAGLLYLGWNLETIIPEWHGWVDYVFIGIGALRLIAGLWPNNWRKRLLGFIAIREGIYVHGHGVYPEGHEWATPETRWLFVPWANVVDVREGLVLKVAGGAPGGTWWPSTKLSLRVTPGKPRHGSPTRRAWRAVTAWAELCHWSIRIAIRRRRTRFHDCSSSGLGRVLEIYGYSQPLLRVRLCRSAALGAGNGASTW